MPRYSDEKIEKALRKARGMPFVTARLLGCSPLTVRRRLAQSERLRQVQNEELGYFLDLTELKLYEAVERGEMWALKFALSTKGASRGYTRRTELTGGCDRQPTQIVEVSARKALRKEETNGAAND